MSQENVEAWKRGVEAINRRDVAALLAVLDPEIEWHSAISMGLGGEETVYRGQNGVREFLRDLYETLSEFHAEYSDVRDLGDRVVAIGQMRSRGAGSGAETKSPIGSVVEMKNGKAFRVQTYFDPKEALEAAGLRE